MRTQGWTLVLLLILGLGLMINPCSLNAQAVSATVLGTVTDTSGAVVPAAKVVITETKTGFTRTAQTNDSGYYVIADVPPGSYDVSAEKQGFKKTLRNAVDVVVNSTVRVDLSLPPGTVAETVTVLAEAPILQTDRADVGSKIESKQVVDLPLGFNRNFQNLLNLIPGTTRAHREHSEFFNSQDSLSTEVNGQTRHFNNLLVEGVDNNERTGLLQVYIPPAEAIQTVDVTTSNYAAEFGRAGGAVTNVTLKSGTNAFHGSAYEFNRTSALAARTFFNRPPGFFPRITYNYYGGTVGGPIIKNKLFFFGDILRVDDSRQKFNRFTVPTALMRTGDFSEVKTLASCQARAADCNIYNPNTGNTNGTNRQQFTYQGRPNVIDPALISPIAQKIFALVPLPNLPGLTNNFQEINGFLKNNTAFDTKVDYQRGDNDRLAFRFSRAVQNVTDQPAFGLAGGPKGGGFQGTGVQHQQSGAVNYTHIFSSTLVAENRAGISHYRNVAHSADYGSKASDALGIPGINLDAFTSGLTTIRFQGINSDDPLVGYSASLPWDRGETNINLVSNWTKIHGNHTFKWGADFRRLRDDLVQAQTFGPRGRFTFNTGTTQLNCTAVSAPFCPSTGASRTSLGNNFAALLIDRPTEVGRDISVVSGAWRETELFTFAQDKWQISPRFTADLGVRWEYYEPAHPSRPGRYSNYDPTTNLLVIAGVGGNPIDLGRETFYHNFAPRLGLAYRFKENTVFRGGFGVSYEPFPDNQYAFNFPVRQAFGSTQGNSFAPACFGTTVPCPAGSQATMAAGFPPPSPVAAPSNGLMVPPSAGESFNVIDKRFRQPYLESWNLAVQRALPWNFVLDVAYVGNHGTRIPVTFDLNAALAPSLCTAQEIALNQAGCGGITPKKVGDIQPANCFLGASTRPMCNQFGRSGGTNFKFKPTSSNYHALQVKLDHKWTHGLLSTTAYTFGKGLAFRDGTSDGGADHWNYLDYRRNYGPLDFNRTHAFVQSFVYELPFGKGKRWGNSGWMNWVAGGWQVSGVLMRLTGLPMEFSSSGTSLAASGTQQTPIQIGPYRELGGIETSPWFDTSVFCAPGTTNANPNCPVVGNGVLGNMTRRSNFTGPRYFNLDAALFRRFAISERIGLEMRAEAFSLTNTPHFNRPDLSATSSNFGKVTSTGLGGTSNNNDGNRFLELGAKITF